MGMIESWKYATSGLEVSGESSQAIRVAVKVTQPGSRSSLGEDSEVVATVYINVDDWREMVLAVEQKLIRRGDPQR